MRQLILILAVAFSATLSVARAGGTVPSGSIVFSSDRSPLLHIVHRYRIGVDGSHERELSFVEGTLSPNGKWRASVTGNALQIANTRGGPVRDITIPDDTGAIRDVVWSPDS